MRAKYHCSNENYCELFFFFFFFFFWGRGGGRINFQLLFPKGNLWKVVNIFLPQSLEVKYTWNKIVFNVRVLNKKKTNQFEFKVLELKII